MDKRKGINMDWISVKDKAPEFPCVVWDGHNYPKTPIGILEAKMENGEVYYFDDEERNQMLLSNEYVKVLPHHITHWLPLPELPKGE